MAEYYPLLAKAIGSIPNSTPETRRVVYERARKALIGQLRTLHPPVPDDDIERESVELDRAVERLESELANGAAAAPLTAPPLVARQPPQPASPQPQSPVPETGAIGPAAKRPLPPLRPRPPKPPEAKPAAPAVPVNRPASLKPPASKAAVPAPPALEPPPVEPLPPHHEPAAPPPPAGVPAAIPADVPSPDMSAPIVNDQPKGPPASLPSTPGDESKRLKPPQRPIAPQPPRAAGPKRRLWIIPVVLVVVVALVAVAAWKLRDRPETIARNKPAEQTQAESGKIAERVGAPSTSSSSSTNDETAGEQPSTSPQPATGTSPKTGPSNPELPIAHRAALLVEAPDEANKVKTFVGSVVWKLNNAPQGATDAVGLAVEADIDLPDDKTKVIVTFEKNSDASLPASHTIKVRFAVEPGSFSGNVKQISVPQMRPEASPNGEALAGVTVQIVPNSFLVGLSPGNAEAANTDLIRRLQWVDIPMLLDNGKIAKLTFEKSDSGQRDLNEAFQAWQK